LAIENDNIGVLCSRVDVAHSPILLDRVAGRIVCTVPKDKDDKAGEVAGQ